MKKLYLLLAFLVLGCSPSLDHRLNQIDETLDDHPAEALASLDSVDRSALSSPRLRARYALLRSVALDKNYIDLQSDSVIAPAVRWYSRHGSAYEKARTLYYQGRVAYNAGDYPAATIDFKKAESYFPKFQNDYLKRLILIAQAQTNNETLFYNENLDLLLRAKALLPARDSSDQRFLLELAIAKYYNNTLQWEQADSVYTAIEDSVDPASSVYPLSQRNHARLLINGEPSDPVRSYQLFRSALSRGVKFYPEDALAYAVALYYHGHKEDALSIINQIEGMKGYDAQVANTRYRIALQDGRLAEALDFQRKASPAQDSVIFASFKQSVVKAQRDYFEEVSARTSERSRFQRITIWLLAALFASSLLSGFALASRRKAKHEAELSRLSDILVQTEALLKQVANEREDYKAKYIAKFKGQFVTLRKMTEDYLGTQGRSDQKEYVFRKVAEMARLVSNDKEGNRQFEHQLNKELGNIMAHFRKDIPGKDESTYRFVSYLIAGFDPPAISLLMGYSIGFIYKKKSLLVAEITQLESAYKPDYLDFLT